MAGQIYNDGGESIIGSVPGLIYPGGFCTGTESPVGDSVPVQILRGKTFQGVGRFYNTTPAATKSAQFFSSLVTSFIQTCILNLSTV